MKIEFTLEQAQKMIALIDLAVKTGGLNTATVGLEIAYIIQTAIEAEKQESKE